MFIYTGIRSGHLTILHWVKKQWGSSLPLFKCFSPLSEQLDSSCLVQKRAYNLVSYKLNIVVVCQIRKFS